MKNKGELVLEALHAMRDVYGAPERGRLTLTITGDSNSPDKPNNRAIGTAWLLGKFDPKLDMCPLVSELVVYRGFVVFRIFDGLGEVGGAQKLTHRKGFAWFIDECWPEYLQNSQ
ncbi:MAG: hypothetical protein AAB669_02250 [Patescibacteria group bacterium]